MFAGAEVTLFARERSEGLERVRIIHPSLWVYKELIAITGIAYMKHRYYLLNKRNDAVMKITLLFFSKTLCYT